MAKRIDTVKLGKNNIDQIDGEFLANLSSITALELDHNRLEELPSELKKLSLSILSLSRNRLVSQSIASSVLGNSISAPLQKRLTPLDLSSNRLEWLPSGLLDFESLRVLNLSNNKITNLAFDPLLSRGWKPGLPALEHLNVSKNHLENLGDLPIAVGACCPLLKTLLLQNNELKMIPPQLGMLTSLQIIDLRGNPQRAVRSAILEKGCDAILLYLHNRLTPAELKEYEVQRNEIRKTLPSMRKASQCAEPRNVRDNETETEQQKRVDKPISSPLADELRAEIDSLSIQLNNLHLSEAKKYAMKKTLAILKSKLILEERRLRDGNRGRPM